MALENYRPIQFPEKTDLDNTNVVLIDSLTNGTNKYQLSRITAEAEAKANAAVAAEATAREQAIAAEKAAREQDVTSLKADLEQLEPGLSAEAKAALLACFAHVAWIDEDGQDYYDALEEALDYTPEPLWDYEWVASSAGTLPPGMIVKSGTPSYDSVTQSLLTNYPDLNFEYVGDGVLEMVLSAPAESGNNYTPQFHAPIAYDGDGQLKEGLVFVNADSNKKIYGTVSGAGQVATDLVIDQTVFHKYKMEVKNGTCNLYIDDDLIGSGYRVSGNAKAFGVASGTVGSTGQYIKFKSIRFKMDVDWFEQMEWCYPGNLTLRGAGAGWVDNAPATYNTKSSPDRASFWVKKGKTGQSTVINDDTDQPTDFYAIPVPPNATKATVSVVPSTYYVGLRTGIWNSENNTWTAGDQTGWAQGSAVLNFTAQENRYITVNSKFNSSGTSGTLPTGIVVNFE